MGKLSALKRLAELASEFRARSAIEKAANAADELKHTRDIQRRAPLTDEQVQAEMLRQKPGETVYHAGANFKTPRPGLFTNPDIAAVERFQQTTGAPKVHSFQAVPRRVGSDQDVYSVAKMFGVYEPGIPAGQYLEQGKDALYPSKAMVEELRNLGYDSLRLNDGIGERPSLVVLDPEILNRNYARGGLAVLKGHSRG